MEIKEYSEGFYEGQQTCLSDDGWTETVKYDFGHKHIVHLNGQVGQTRMRFTKCHELGHIYLDHWSNYENLPLEQAEGEANFFANYLLVPTVLSHSWLGKDATHIDIQEMFNVSFDAALYAKQRISNAIYHGELAQPYSQMIIRNAKRDEAVFVKVADLRAQILGTA